MKNLICILFATILSIGVSVAQEKGPRQMKTPEEMAKSQVENLKEKLTLNQTQQDSIYKYVLQANIERQSLMQNTDGDRTAAREKMMVLRKTNAEKIKSFLSDEQKVKYNALEEKRSMRLNPKPNNNP